VAGGGRMARAFHRRHGLLHGRELQRAG
jgi:hypothetical protein